MVKRIAACIREFKRASILTAVLMIGEVLLEVLIPAVMAALMLAVNDRAARVEMPPPDNTFGIYRGADSR